MAGGKRPDRRGSGLLWWLALVAIVFALYSATVAAVTAGDCGDLPKEWQVFPPAWECQRGNVFE